jgi:photosystem I P700 chlorophyll a apoprotein A2
LHTTTFLFVKGALDARGSKLMPEKKDLRYSFPCDGPGRGALVGFPLGFGSFLNVQYYWMGYYFLLALEAHHIMAG